MGCLKNLATIWRTIVIVLVPIVALPILLVDGSREFSALYGLVMMASYWITEALPLAVTVLLELSALYGLVIMASYWITEALPLAVTALLPVVIFPLLSVTSAKDVAQNYIKNASMFGFVCLAFSLCVEKWNLHRRIALRTMLLMGSSPKWLMLGFMIPTWFLSLWVNNTAATAMMLPIVSAVLSNLQHIKTAAAASSTSANRNEDERDVIGHDMVALKNVVKEEKVEGESPFGQETAAVDHEDELLAVQVENIDPSQRQEDEKNLNMRKAMNICICYASSVGGIGSMAGTSTNVIMHGHTEDVFRSYGLDSGVNFLSWMLCCLPVALICLGLAWAWLVCFFFGPRELFKCEWRDKKSNERTRRTILTFLEEMGPMKFAEKAVLFHFVLLMILMLTMKLPGGGGWVLIFQSGYVKNSVPALSVLVMTFIVPSQWSRQGYPKDKPVPALLEWKDVQEKLPWGTIMLIGGGYGLAFAIEDSGLSQLIGVKLSSMAGSHEPWVIILLLSLCISFMTEVTSNATTASILCPILAELAISLQVHPLYFLFPGVLACSLAFMLPVATPPNTLVFATGDIRVKDMVKVGFFLNIMCVCVVNLAINTWMWLYFGLGTIPKEMTMMPTTTTTTTTMMDNSTDYNQTIMWTMGTMSTMMDNSGVTLVSSVAPSLYQNVSV